MKGDGAVYFEPTVLIDVEHGMEIVDEETFGPTIQIMRVENSEEAVRLANDSKYGLAAAVYSGDARRAEAVARRIEAGTVSINDSLVFWPSSRCRWAAGRSPAPGSAATARSASSSTPSSRACSSRVRRSRRCPQMFPYGKGSKLLKAITKLYFRF